MSRTRKHKLTGAKRFSPSCRNHGACDWCRRNRTYNELRDKEKAEYDEKEFRNENAMTRGNSNNLIYQDNNAYQIGRRDERMEWAEKIFSTSEKCFKEAHEEAIEAACSYLYAKTKMTATEISEFRKTMEEHLCKGI